MDNVLANASNVKCYAYDIIVHSASIEELIKHLEKVMYLLRNHGLRVRLSKRGLLRCYLKHMLG